MFANKLCVKTFQVKNVPLTLTLSLDLKTSILIRVVDGFLYHITEGLGVDVSLVMIRVILKKKKVVLCCYRTLESIIFDFCQVSLLCYLWTYISIHFSTYIQLIFTKFCIHGGVIWRWVYYFYYRVHVITYQKQL